MDDLVDIVNMSHEALEKLKQDYWLNETADLYVYKKVPKTSEEKEKLKNLNSNEFGYHVRVQRSAHQKCARCWKCRPEVRRVWNNKFTDVCNDCLETLKRFGYQANWFSSPLSNGKVDTVEISYSSSEENT